MPGKTMLTDIGVNLVSRKFRNVPNMLQDAANTNVGLIITISNGMKEIPRNVEYCKQYSKAPYPSVYTTMGVHPHNAKDLHEKAFTALREYVTTNRQHVVAIGECGLDYDRDFSPRPVQRKWFERQIALSIELDLPLYFHERAATQDFLQCVDKYADDIKGRGVVHCFTGSKEALDAYLDRGFYIGITGWCCDAKRGQELCSLIPHIPLDKLLIETDAPYLTPHSVRKKHKFCTPAMVDIVAQKVADLRNVTKQSIIDATTRNALKFFNIPQEETHLLQ